MTLQFYTIITGRKGALNTTYCVLFPFINSISVSARQKTDFIVEEEVQQWQFLVVTKVTHAISQQYFLSNFSFLLCFQLQFQRKGKQNSKAYL